MIVASSGQFRLDVTRSQRVLGIACGVTLLVASLVPVGDEHVNVHVVVHQLEVINRRSERS